MVSSRTRDIGRQWTAFVMTACMLLPMLIVGMPSANAQIFGGNRNPNTPAKPGMSTGKKLLLVGGAALLYYLYKKHQASVAAKQVATNPGMANANAPMPQLYRSKNGGVYYRDAQHNPVWLTVPQQGMQVSQQELQRYAPDYSQYNGPAPAAPRGYRVQQFSDFDPNAFGGAPVPARGGNGTPPGPRGF